LFIITEHRRFVWPRSGNFFYGQAQQLAIKTSGWRLHCNIPELMLFYAHCFSIVKTIAAPEESGRAQNNLLSIANCILLNRPWSHT
jgi:hypothetical protein